MKEIERTQSRRQVDQEEWEAWRTIPPPHLPQWRWRHTCKDEIQENQQFDILILHSGCLMWVKNCWVESQKAFLLVAQFSPNHLDISNKLNKTNQGEDMTRLYSIQLDIENISTLY